MTQTNTRTEFKVWLKGGEVVNIEAYSEKHTRQAISRGRKVGRYNGRVIRVDQVESAERFNGRHIEPIGSRYWRCMDCGQQIEAECECCEPPRCGKCGA